MSDLVTRDVNARSECFALSVDTGPSLQCALAGLAITRLSSRLLNAKRVRLKIESLCSFYPSQTPTGRARSAMLRMRASRSLALTSVFARGMAISVGDAFPKGVSVQVPPSPPPPAPSPLPPSPAQLNPPSLPPSPPARRLRLHHRLQTCRRLPRHHQVNFKENLPIESLTSKGNVLMVSLPGAFTPT